MKRCRLVLGIIFQDLILFYFAIICFIVYFHFIR